MKIGLIVHPYGEKHPAGLGKAIAALTKAIIEEDASRQYTIFTKGSVSMPEIKGNHWKIVSLPTHPLWIDFGLSKNERQDIYIFFTPFMPLFFIPIKSIVIAHDFSYKYIPTHGFMRKLKRFFVPYIHSYSLKKSDKVVAVSLYTKEEMIKFFNIPSSKIEIVYNGFTPICHGSNHHSLDLPQRYFLFVGVIKERKNVFRLVQAYSLAYQMNNYKDFPDLVIAGNGSGAYYEKIKHFIIEKKLEKKVIFKGYVPDNELEKLYKNAWAFLYPSLIEGFGLPILEAMNCGIPVITSDRGAMKEVASDAAILVNPENVESIAQGIIMIYSNQSQRKLLIDQGNQRQRIFSWKNAAQKYHSIIKDITVKYE